MYYVIYCWFVRCIALDLELHKCQILPISLIFNRQGHVDYIRILNVLSAINNACDSNANLYTGRVACLFQEAIVLVCLLIVPV